MNTFWQRNNPAFTYADRVTRKMTELVECPTTPLKLETWTRPAIINLARAMRIGK